MRVDGLHFHVVHRAQTVAHVHVEPHAFGIRRGVEDLLALYVLDMVDLDAENCFDDLLA